jgi:hypothetical protein
MYRSTQAIVAGADIQRTAKSLAEKMHEPHAPAKRFRAQPALTAGRGKRFKVLQYTRPDASRRTIAAKLFAFSYAVPSLLLCRCQ